LEAKKKAKFEKDLQ